MQITTDGFEKKKRNKKTEKQAREWLKKKRKKYSCSCVKQWRERAVCERVDSPSNSLFN